jgi:hypothetical protein
LEVSQPLVVYLAVQLIQTQAEAFLVVVVVPHYLVSLHSRSNSSQQVSVSACMSHFAF